MTDAALDRELQTLLGVDPSPEFVARLRTRIDDEPSPSRLWLGVWTVLGSAVAVAAILIVAVVVSRDARSGAPGQPPVLDSRIAMPSAWTVPTLRGRPRAGSDRPAARPRRPETADLLQPATAQRLEPEVLVDAREAAAIRALISGTRAGRIDLTAVANASAPSVMELPPVADIEIPVLTIEPIAPGTGEQGVRQ